MRLILVRHGETEDNLKGIIQGQRPGKLTEKGKEQAKKLAERLKDEKIDVIFSSDLERAKETTKEIAKYHKVPVHYTSELRERSFGVFDGKTGKEYFGYLERNNFSKAEFRPEGGESDLDLRERLTRFFKKLLKEYEKENILISAHGRANAMLLGVLLDLPIEISVELTQFNTCVNIVEIKEGKGKPQLINCIKHLNI